MINCEKINKVVVMRFKYFLATVPGMRQDLYTLRFVLL
jgi:hypothetical protein